jgi:hypothetical protein
MSDFHKKATRNATLNGTADQTVITATPNAIKDADNVLHVEHGKNIMQNLSSSNSTLLFADGSYDLEPG